MTEITISRDGEKFGPYTPEQLAALLASGQVVGTDLAWHPGLNGWVPLQQLEGFTHLAPVAAPAAASTSNATARYLARQQSNYEATRRARARSGRRTLLIALAVAVPLLALAALGVAAALFASGAHSVFSGLDQSTTDQTGTLSTSLHDYDRGLLHSTAVLGVKSGADLPGEPARVTPFLVDIYHGPVLTGPGGMKLGNQRIVAVALENATSRKPLTATPGGPPLLKVVAELDLDNNLTIDATLAPSDGTFVPSVTFGGGTAHLDYNHTAGTLHGSVDLGALTVDLDGDSFVRSAPVTAHLDLDGFTAGILTHGSGALEVPEVTVRYPGITASITSASIRTDVSTTAGKMTQKNAYRIGGLTVTSEDPPLDIRGDASFELTIAGIDVATLAELQGAPSGDPAYSRMVQDGLRFSVAAKVNGTSGGASASASIAYTGEGPPDGVQDPAALAEVFTAHAKFRVDKSLVADGALEELLAGFGEDGTLADAGDSYRFTFSHREGAARLNGEPFDVIPLLESWFTIEEAPPAPPGLPGIE